jgi:integrase
MPTLTKRTLKTLKPRQWAVENVGKGQPQLRAKGSPSGLHRFYLRYSRSDGTQDDLPLGAFDDLDAARRAAAPLIARYRAGTLDLRETIEAEKAAKEAAKRAAIEAAERERARARRTLRALCEAYADDLRSAGKVSHAAVMAALRRAFEGTPLWTRPVDEVTGEHITRVLNALVAAGKRREAAKVRSYLRAAFRRAVEARLDPNASAAMRALALTHDPTAGVRTIRGAIRARDRALSVAELRAYWSALREVEDPAGSLLRFHLLTGCQRVEQLARVTMRDLDREAGTMTLWDPKGRREQPRRHVVPLIPPALAEIERLRGPNPTGPFVFSLDGGATSATYFPVKHRLRKVVRVLLAQGLVTAPFTPGDLRRTVETRFAALGVPQEVRARLQSHGLGGIQARHYDRHDYLDEVREALERFADFLEGAAAAVIPLTRRLKPKL